MPRSVTTRFGLAQGKLIRLPSTAREVHCESGTLWITQDGDPRDIVLEAGQHFRRDGNAGTIVYALALARMTLHHALQGRLQGTSRSAHRIPSAGRFGLTVQPRTLERG